MRKRRNDRTNHAIANGYRSGFEDQIVKQLKEQKVRYGYETANLVYVVPESNHKYTPDILLANGTIIELKGRWVTADRKKLKLIHDQFPDIRFRILFSNSKTKISKKSKTTYGKYADKYLPNWEWADMRKHGCLPQAWIDAEVHELTLTFIKEQMQVRKVRTKRGT